MHGEQSVDPGVNRALRLFVRHIQLRDRSSQIRRDDPRQPGRPRQASVEVVDGAVEPAELPLDPGLLLWREGRFRFIPGAPGSPGSVSFEMDLEQLALDVLRIADAA